MNHNAKIPDSMLLQKPKRNMQENGTTAIEKSIWFLKRMDLLNM